MSKINDLIEKLCPCGVYYKKLSEIGDTFTGLSGKNKNDFINGNARFITYTNIYNNPAVRLDLDDMVTIKYNENQNELKYGDILVAGSSENLEDSGMISVVCEEPMENIYLNSFCFGFRLNNEYKNKLIPGFSKHIFRSASFRNQIVSCSFGVTRYNLNKKMFLDLTIPIPPIEVQEEIVRILDKFGELEAELEVELEAELEARKSQYAFWRGKLLSNGDYNIVKINDITHSVSSGKCSSRSETGAYSVYGSTGIIARTDEYAFDEEKLLIARVGANAGYVHIADGKYNVTDNTLIVDLKEDVNLRFMYYNLQNYNLNKLAKGGGQPLITGGQIKELEIILPPLSEQKKIAKILDKFDSLVNDIIESLPAEIELRRKQYEYYRNKLLRFEELNNEKV